MSKAAILEAIAQCAPTSHVRPKFKKSEAAREESLIPDSGAAHPGNDIGVFPMTENPSDLVGSLPAYVVVPTSPSLPEHFLMQWMQQRRAGPRLVSPETGSSPDQMRSKAMLSLAT